MTNNDNRTQSLSTATRQGTQHLLPSRVFPISVFPRQVYLTDLYLSYTCHVPETEHDKTYSATCPFPCGPSVTMTKSLMDEQGLSTYVVEICRCVPTTHLHLTKKWHVRTSNIRRYVQWYVAKYTKHWKALTVTTQTKLRYAWSLKFSHCTSSEKDATNFDLSPCTMHNCEINRTARENEDSDPSVLPHAHTFPYEPISGGSLTF